MATNVYVRNVPLDWDKETLEKTFSEHGRVVSSKIMLNPTTSVSRSHRLCADVRTLWFVVEVLDLFDSALMRKL